MNFKETVSDVASKLEELETAARKLDNQHLADIVRDARGRMTDAANHPDVDRVDASDEQRNLALEDDPNLNSGGNALFAAGDPGVALQNEEARRRAAFPFPDGDVNGLPINDTSKLDPEAKHPGDPSFMKPNADFRDPNAVNLNDDGTLKQAPNSLGASDNRDEKK